jgi:hypothetical protein
MTADTDDDDDDDEEVLTGSSISVAASYRRQITDIAILKASTAFV